MIKKKNADAVAIGNWAYFHPLRIIAHTAQMRRTHDALARHTRDVH